MSVVDKLRGTEVTPRTALLSIVVLLLATAGVLTAVVKVLNGPSSSAGTPEKAGAPITAAKASGDGGKYAPAPAGKADYGVIAKRNLFHSPRKIEVAAVAPVAPPPFPTKKQTEPFNPFRSGPTTPEMTPPPLAFTGVVEVGGETYALIEHLESHDAQYVPVGGKAFGCTVTEINARAVSLEIGNTPFMLNIGENKTEPEPTPPPAAQQNNRQPGGAPPDGAAQPGGGQPGEGRFNRGMPPNGDGLQGRGGRFNRENNQGGNN